MDDDQLREHFGATSEPRSPWSRWQLIAGAAVVVMAVGVGLVWFYVLRADERSTSEISSQIHSWADKNTRGGGTITVDCPDPVEWRVGETFNCIVSQGKQSVRVVVTMENDAGDVTWVAG